MHHIRRAAVTGLLAVWLAPLSAAADARATTDDRCPTCEARAADRAETPCGQAAAHPARAG